MDKNENDKRYHYHLISYRIILLKTTPFNLRPFSYATGPRPRHFSYEKRSYPGEGVPRKPLRWLGYPSQFPISIS
jgi:hypothetical protein